MTSLHSRPRFVATLALLIFSFVLTGCWGGPDNPSFAVAPSEAKQYIAKMSEQPVELERPVVILSGWIDPGFGPYRIRKALDKTTTGQPIVSVTYAMSFGYDTCRRRTIAAINEALGPPINGFTPEVDVICLSMGGLVARYAAAPIRNASTPEDEVRLNIVNFYSIGSPHRGARLAQIPTFEPMIAPMRPGSDFLQYLDEHEPSFSGEAVSYVLLHDGVVGADRADLEGSEFYWLPTPFTLEPHNEAMNDPRIVGDILRRLRGELPLASGAPVPLPD